MELEYNITYRKKDKGIQAIISYKNSSGKWKQKSKQGFEDNRKGKAEAKNWALQAIKSIDDMAKLDGDYTNVTFKNFFDDYIKHVSLSYSVNTIRTYNLAYKHFKAIAEKPVSKIKPIDIQNCIDDMKRNGMSDNSIATYTDKIKALLNYAVKNRIININPVLVKLKRTKADKTALTELELNTLLVKLKDIDTKFYIACLLAGKCGLREGEICGLTWNDIYTDYIDINKQWKNIDDKGLNYFGSLKTQNSKRKVPISSKIHDDLMNYKKQLICIDINNRILDYKSTASFSVTIRKMLHRLDYNISIHELRHTYTTLLIQHGLDFKTVAALIGDDVAQVMKTYSHVNSDMYDNAKRLINNIF